MDVTAINMPLDTIPHDILQHIAYLLAISSVPELPQYLLPLLLTCSRIHRVISRQHCPHLYANIFRATFDYDHSIHGKLTDSMLAAELHHRYRILWRTKRQDIVSDPTMEELWSAVRLVLENEARNERLLVVSGFSTFIMACTRHRLLSPIAYAKSTFSKQRLPVMTVILWLFCLTLTHQDIVDTSESIRSELSRVLRFQTTLMKPGTSTYHLPTQDDSDETPQLGTLVYVPDATHIALLEKAEPIIILLFALAEAEPLTIPPHLPQTRAIAIATQRSGPTMEDMRAITKFRTPLFSETRFTSARVACTSSSKPKPPTTNTRSALAHEIVYKSLLRPVVLSSYLGPDYVSGYSYVPGSLAGLWEGTFMISGEPRPSDPTSPAFLGDFQYLRPMQCAFTEYLCFSPHLPIPSDYPLDLLETAVKARKFEYEEYSGNELPTGRDPTNALDVVIIGKTLSEHEQAWNGFRFAGRVGRSDGYIVMLREPKNPADREGLGTWVFEGHLRYGLAFVGQWQSSAPTESCDLRGIFSLRKTDDYIGWRE